MDDDRLINIETKLAHQEHLIGELNEALSSQQAQLTKLETICEALLERLRAIDDLGKSGVGDAIERPPHY